MFIDLAKKMGVIINLLISMLKDPVIMSKIHTSNAIYVQVIM